MCQPFILDLMLMSVRILTVIGMNEGLRFEVHDLQNRTETAAARLSKKLKNDDHLE